MNKKVNIYLNIVGFISFIISFSLIFVSLRLETNTEVIINIIRYIVSILGMISGCLFIFIDLFLFTLYKNKIKVLYVVYMVLDIVLALYLNSIFDYSYILVFLSFRLIKDITRLLLVNKIYVPKKLNQILKLYGLKVNDTKSKTKSNLPKKKTIVSIPKENKMNKRVEV